MASVPLLIEMFCAGGGIHAHAIAPLRDAMAQVARGAADGVASMLLNGIVGIAAGAIVPAVVTGMKPLRPKAAQ